MLNATDPAGIIANGGFPFTPANGINFKRTVFARCANPRQLSCTAEIFATVAYDRGCGFDLALSEGRAGWLPARVDRRLGDGTCGGASVSLLLLLA